MQAAAFKVADGPVRSWADVPGWLGPSEGEALADLARDRTVLEIGSFLGRSTAALASTARRVWAVDWHFKDRCTASVDVQDTLPGLRRNLTDCGLADKVIILCGLVDDVQEHLVGPFDLVFIDGAHDAKSVARDAALARRVVAPGGVVAFHDVDEPGIAAGAETAGVWPLDVLENTRIGVWRSP